MERLVLSSKSNLHSDRTFAETFPHQLPGNTGITVSIPTFWLVFFGSARRVSFFLYDPPINTEISNPPRVILGFDSNSLQTMNNTVVMLGIAKLTLRGHSVRRVQLSIRPQLRTAVEDIPSRRLQEQTK
jgi:hypothetical protein